MSVRRTKYGVIRKNKKKSNKQEGETLQEKYSDLYTELLGAGIEEDKIVEELERIDLSQRLQEAMYDDGQVPSDHGITIRIQYGLDDIRSGCKWDVMGEAEKVETLWGIGFNTRDYNYHTEMRSYISVRGNKEYGTAVYGQERLDKEWLKQRDCNGKLVASDAAIMYTDRNRDEGFREDIDNISGRGNLWEVAVEKIKEERGVL